MIPPRCSSTGGGSHSLLGKVNFTAYWGGNIKSWVTSDPQYQWGRLFKLLPPEWTWTLTTFSRSLTGFFVRAQALCLNGLNIRYIYRKYAPSRALNSASQHIPFSGPNHTPDSSNVKLTYVFTLILNAWTIGSASTSFTLLPIYEKMNVIRYATAQPANQVSFNTIYMEYLNVWHVLWTGLFIFALEKNWQLNHRGHQDKYMLKIRLLPRSWTTRSLIQKRWLHTMWQVPVSNRTNRMSPLAFLVWSTCD